MQLEIDFSGRLPVRAQEGMAAADAHADQRWKTFFDACVLAAARKQEYITSDDVLTELESLPNPPSTHNLSAIGPAMRRGVSSGIIVPTDHFQRSARPLKRGNLQRRYRSTVYTRGKAAQ